jgi:type IV pilus assembly protein PilE
MKSRQKGFNLIELMVTIAVMAVLAAIAIPLYQDYIYRAKRNACKAVLVSTAGVLERRHSAANDYKKPGVTAPDDQDHLPGDTPADRPTCPEKGTTTYSLAISNVTASTWALTATPVGSQTADQCGTLAIDHLGRKFAGTGSVDFTQDPGSCW